MAGDDRFVWLDLEMTGLDETRDSIVEIACLVSDTELRILDDGVHLVVHQPPEALAGMGDRVREMHTASGLLTAVAASDVDLPTAGARVLAYVRSHVPEPGVAPLCGNSIGTDRRFIARHLPDLDAYLHYRVVDVSSVKELARRWFPTEFRKRPDKAESHRALDDVRESIEELRYYRETVFKAATKA